MLASVNKKQWHHRLGHPSSQLVQSILSLNKLPVCGSHDASVCDACQHAKSHQLPYGPSSFVAKFPLELVYSDVWGPATQSVGGFKYYVSFIDVFSKFTWIYLLRAKSSAYSITKLFVFSWIGVANTNASINISKLVAFHIMCPVHIPTNRTVLPSVNIHIVETGLSLLAHSCMPVRFWDEAFLTATFLIN
jgi:histone deacetylase 1/2